MAKNLYSPSMLKSFLNCKYTIFNEINEKALKLVRKEKGFSDLKLLERGNVHDIEEEKVFWRIYYTIDEKIVILGESIVNPQLFRYKSSYL